MEVLTSKIHNKPTRPVKILQVGEGNFLRGFCDWFIQKLNEDTDYEGSICMVQPRDSHKIERFNNQDCMYTVITEGLDKGEVVSYSDVIDVIDNVLDPYEEYDRFLNYAKNDDLEVFLSNTTESGIRLDENDTDLSKTPTSFPGKLLAFLKTRYDHYNGAADAGLYIVPTELITNNGDTLRSVLVELAKINGLSEDFINWMTTANKFYNTLVDRIIPGFPKDDIDKWQEKWGYEDNLAVKGEVYRLWCIQGDRSILDVLPFDKTDLSIIVCDDITPYKERKVKILNGSHTFTVSTAYQLGFRVVNKTVADERIKTLLNRYNYNEVLPTINLPETEKEEFKDAVFDRFGNPTIQHMWTSIMLNSMSKYKERILPVVQQINAKNGKLPKLGLFAAASLFSLYAVKNDDGKCIVEDEPEFNEFWANQYDGSHNDDEIINSAMDLDCWEDAFDKIEGARDFVVTAFKKIRSDGMDSAVNWILAETE